MRASTRTWRRCGARRRSCPTCRLRVPRRRKNRASDGNFHARCAIDCAQRALLADTAPTGACVRDARVRVARCGHRTCGTSGTVCSMNRDVVCRSATRIDRDRALAHPKSHVRDREIQISRRDDVLFQERNSCSRPRSFRHVGGGKHVCRALVRAADRRDRYARVARGTANTRVPCTAAHEIDVAVCRPSLPRDGNVSFAISEVHRVASCARKAFGAGGGNRTHTPLTGPGILSPVRLPVSPPRRVRAVSHAPSAIIVRAITPAIRATRAGRRASDTRSRLVPATRTLEP